MVFPCLVPPTKAQSGACLAEVYIHMASTSSVSRAPPLHLCSCWQRFHSRRYLPNQKRKHCHGLGQIVSLMTKRADSGSSPTGVLGRKKHNLGSAWRRASLGHTPTPSALMLAVLPLPSISTKPVTETLSRTSLDGERDDEKGGLGWFSDCCSWSFKRQSEIRPA